MAVTTEDQADHPAPRWRGIASFMIGAASITLTLLLLGMAINETEPPRPVIAALGLLTSLVLFANLIGLAFGFSGARDRASRKLYPLLGLALNAANLTIYVALAFVGG